VFQSDWRCILGDKVKLDEGYEHRGPLAEQDRGVNVIGNDRRDDAPFLLLPEGRVLQNGGDPQQVTFYHLKDAMIRAGSSFVLFIVGRMVLFSQSLNCINDLADQPFLAFAAVDASADLEGLLFGTAHDIAGRKAETNPFAQSAVATPLTEQIAI